MAATYCTVAQVRRVLQTEFNFDQDTRPSEDEVIEAIEEAEEEINQETQASWKEENVSNEFYDLKRPNQFRWGLGHKIFLRHRHIRSIDAGEGDKIEVYNGSSYDDWVATKTEGRNSDYWLDHEQGILYLRTSGYTYYEKELRMTYRYGESTVPKDIRKATALLAAMDLISADDRSAMLSETGDPTRLSYSDRIKNAQAKVDKILCRRTDFFVV